MVLSKDLSLFSTVSYAKHYVDIPFPVNGTWKDLLNEELFTVSDYWRRWQDIDRNWGRIFYFSG